MNFDEETNDTFEDILDTGSALVEEAIATVVDGSMRKPDDIPRFNTVKEMMDHYYPHCQKEEVARLNKIIEHREHDIDILTSENVQLRDEVAGLKDEIGELKRKLR